MSTAPIQTHIFLPAYLLESVEYGNPSRIDPNIFLSKATTPQLLKVIHAFHPHFTFIDTARDNHKVLKRVFCSMVAFCLSRIPILNLQPEPHYFKVKLEQTIWGPQDSRTTVQTDTVPNRDQIKDFNTLVLAYLHSGHYCGAANKLVNLVQAHQYLNRDEISEIQDTRDEIDEIVCELVSSLGKAHESLKGIHFLLTNSRILRQDRDDLEMQLQSAIALIKSRQSMLDRAIQDAGFVAELVDHYQKLPAKNDEKGPPSSPSQDPHRKQQIIPATPSSVE